MPIAVIGPGAIGGLLAAAFARSGETVLFVGRRAAWATGMRKTGLRVSGESFSADAKLTAKKILPCVHPKGPLCRAMFVSVKSPDTQSALAQARLLVGPDTAVVSLQNGLTHTAHYKNNFSRSQVVFGACYLAGERLGPSRVFHHGGNEMELAIHPDNQNAVASARQMLERSGWRVRLRDCEDRLLWTKAVFNAALNPLGALTGRTNGELARIAPLKEILLRSLQEAGAAAKAAGHFPLYKNMQKPLLAGCLSAPQQKNSMLQDIRAGHPTEMESILRPILDSAGRAGISVPWLKSLYKFTRSLERQLRKRRS